MRQLICLFFILIQNTCFADTIHVTDMVVSTLDNSCSNMVDLNGDECACLTIETELKDLQFVGNIVECKTSVEGYRVYLISGTRKISVFHSAILPTDIVFNDYGIKYVKPSYHYSLKFDIIPDSEDKINLFDDSPEMIYTRYEYASQLTENVSWKTEQSLFDEIREANFNRENNGETLLTEDEEYLIAKKYLPQISKDIDNLIAAVKLGFAPALEELKERYRGKYSDPFIEPFFKELKADSENKLSRMMVNYITDVSTYNPLKKLMEQSIATACGLIQLPAEDNIDFVLPMNEKTLEITENIIKYNEIAYKLGNYRIECKIKEPNLILHAKFVNKPYRILSANDYNPSSRMDAKESYLRIKLMFLWQQIKDFCNNYSENNAY